MTALGALLYCGFFGLAALWLFATSDYRVTARAQAHAPQRSNSASVAAAAGESSPRLLTHASSK